MNDRKKDYTNPYYINFGESDWLALKPNIHMKSFVLWEEYFLQYGWIPKTKYDEDVGMDTEDA